jgi:glucose/arabinose dehydrogenase
MKKITLLIFLLIFVFVLNVFPVFAKGKNPDPKDIKLQDGYKIEAYISGLSVPTTAIFDGQDMLVAESGFVETSVPRVLRITPQGKVTVEAQKGLIGPVTGLLMVDDKLYVSHKGKVSIVENGNLKDIVTGLPSDGDHQNNKIVLGPDGKIYMGQGTVTNTGVVGEDSVIFGWLPKKPKLHETPCKDIVLTGQNFETDNPLTKDEDDKALTGAYKPFGEKSSDGERIKGNPKCGGSIVRFNKDGSGFELYSWGLRNPYGLEFDEKGQLWTTFHGSDTRGSRSIFADPDYLVRVEKDAWYGWPDFAAGEPVEGNARFDDPLKPAPKFLLKEHPKLTQPYLTFNSHEASNGMAISKSDEFGFRGDAFIAMFGSFLNVTSGVGAAPVGYKVVRVDLDTKEITDFASNVLPGPSFVNTQEGFDRPSDVVFGPDNALYVTDWGGSKLGTDGLKFDPETGVVWRIYPEDKIAARPDGPIKVAGVATEPKPVVPNITETWREITPQFGVYAGLIILLIILVWVARKIF